MDVKWRWDGRGQPPRGVRGGYGGGGGGLEGRFPLGIPRTLSVHSIYLNTSYNQLGIINLGLVHLVLVQSGPISASHLLAYIDTPSFYTILHHSNG